MITLGQIVAQLNDWAPFETAEAYDNVGLLLGDANAPIARCFVCVDITPAVVQEAICQKADAIISHHPLIFKGLKQILPQSSVAKLVAAGVGVVALHTNWDKAPDGVEDSLAKCLDLNEIAPLLPNGQGRIGTLLTPLTPAQFYQKLCQTFSLPWVRITAGQEPISLVATLCGCGEDGVDFAVQSDCQAIVTGEMRHQYFTEHLSAGKTMACVGHFESERPGMVTLCEKLQEAFPSVQWVLCPLDNPFYQP